MPTQNGYSWWQAFIWAIPPGFLPTSGTGGTPPTGQILNKQIGLSPGVDFSEVAPATTYQGNGRPSSNHPGGFIATMCDGHSQFISEDIEYRVYCLLMTPDGANAKYPNGGAMVGYPMTWAPAGPLTPLSEADFQ